MRQTGATEILAAVRARLQALRAAFPPPRALRKRGRETRRAFVSSFAALSAAARRLRARAALYRRALSGGRAAAGAAWAALFFERFWRRFLPALLVALLFAALSWLNLWAALPPVLHGLALAVFAAALSAAAWFLCRLRPPSRAEAEARLAADSGLRFDELALAKTKLPPGAGKAAQALWRAHRQRMRRALPKLKTRPPRPNIPVYDPLALRAAVFLLFAAAFAYSFGGGSGRLKDAFYFGAPLDRQNMRIEAWINPPEWTGRPPVYLTPARGESGGAEQNISVPEGSVLAVRAADNGRGLARLRCAFASGREAAARSAFGAGGSAYDMRLSASVRCGFSAPFVSSVWNIAVEADKAPQISWAGAPERALSGALKLRYQIYDDYGVKKAWAEITPLADSAAAPLYFARLTGQKQLITRPGGSLTLWRGDNAAPGAGLPAALQGAAGTEGQEAVLASAKTGTGNNAAERGTRLIPLPQLRLALPRFDAEQGGRRGGAAQTETDFSGSAWAGAFVSLRLFAEDGSGKIGVSAPRRLVLPQPNFISPLSRSLSEQRRLLAESSAAAGQTAAALNALLLWPEKVIADKSAALALFSLRTRLKTAMALPAGEEQNAALRDAADYMGVIARGLDGGKLAAAAMRLRRAAAALRDALRNGASAGEIARLMRNLRGAMDDYIAMLAERGAQSGGQDVQMLGDGELEKKLKALEDAARQGQRGTAEQMLSDFEDLMKNLQVTQGGGGGSSGKSGKQSQMQKQMDALSDIMRRQQRLLDDTHKKSEEESGNAAEEGGQSADKGKQPKGEGKNKDKGQTGGQPQGDLSGRQQKLQQDLQNLQRQMEGQGFAPKDGFGAAQRQMDSSGRALRGGDSFAAQSAQAQALQSLRDDAQKVMEQMRAALARQDAEAKGSAGGAPGQESPNGQDPLGRPSGAGTAGSGESLPEGEAQNRARRILEEIRKRLGALTPRQEKEYLERLLNFE